jgi:hypothetical protein
MSSKAQKGKQLLQQTTVSHINPKYVKEKPKLRSSELREAGQYCVELHNYYIDNYKTSDNIIVEYKQHHFC